MKRISAFAFDTKQKALILLRERKAEADESFEIYSVKIRKFLNKDCTDDELADVNLTDVATVLGDLNVFTPRISVFSPDEVLTVAAVYV